MPVLSCAMFLYIQKASRSFKFPCSECTSGRAIR